MIENQAYLFVVFTLTGIILGIIFDFFRVLRKIFKTVDFITYIEDIIYWIFAGLIILYNIWFFNDGEIRFFMIIGIFIGAIIYALTFSSIFIKIESFFMKKIKFLFIFFYNILKIPIEKIIILFKYMIKLINNKIKVE